MTSVVVQKGFGERLREHRLQAGLSKSGLGRLAGTTQRRIILLERGDLKVTLRNVYALADALGVKRAALLPDDRRPAVPLEPLPGKPAPDRHDLDELGDGRDALIVRARFRGRNTLKEIGRRWNLTKQRVQQICRRFLDGLTTVADDRPYFCRQLHRARLTRQKTQQQLADASGIWRSVVGGLEAGTLAPTLAHLVALADALEVPYRTFVEEKL